MTAAATETIPPRAEFRTVRTFPVASREESSGTVGISRGEVLARAAAGLSLAGVAAHLTLAGAHAGHGLLLGLLTVGMAAACLGCATATVRRPGRRRLVELMAMSQAMALLHAVLLAGPPGVGHVGHGGHVGVGAPSAWGAGAGLSAAGGHDVVTAGLLAILAIELGAALLCALALRSRPRG